MYETLKISGENIIQVFLILFKGSSLEIEHLHGARKLSWYSEKTVYYKKLLYFVINVIVTIDDPSLGTPFSGFHKVNAHSNFDFYIKLPYSHVNFIFR